MIINLTINKFRLEQAANPGPAFEIYTENLFAQYLFLADFNLTWQFIQSIYNVPTPMFTKRSMIIFLSIASIIFFSDIVNFFYYKTKMSDNCSISF